MNITVIRRIAADFDKHSREISERMRSIDHIVAALEWEGHSAQRFRSEWRHSHRPLMQQICRTLGENGELLKRQADAQETASQASGLSTAAPLLPTGPGGDPTGPNSDRTDSGYSIGPPQPPQITWDEDFVWGSQPATVDDYLNATKWRSIAEASRFIPGLEDASAAYRHYWDNNGEPFEIDYNNAAEEDPSIRANIDSEIRRSMAAAEELARSGHSAFSMTGPATSISDNGSYPQTENWQKALGGYQQWSSAEVSVSGNTATMTITVHAEDYYNFNRGASDITSGTPDDVNGRFTEVGWAKPFPTHGSVVRTVTWELGSGTPTITAPAQGGGR